MAVDGSFCIGFEYERFIARCPDLGSVPNFSNLLSKGDSISEEEVVNAVAELILNPKYTIPLVGVFRPIAQKILDRAVGLLRLVPNLKSNSDDTMDMDTDNDETNKLEGGDVIHLIDFYARKDRGLDLHELVCLAFSRVLDLIPSLLGSVLIYFKFAPPPFQRIISRELMSGTTSKDWSKLLGVVRVSYRLLLTDPELFTTLWDWSCVLDIEKMCPELNQYGDAELLRMVQDLKWCGTQILLVVLKLSDTTTEKLGVSDSEAFTCFLRWKEFSEDVSLEKAGWYLEPDDVKLSETGCNDVSLQSLSLGSLDIRSAETGETPSWAATFSGNPFVLTSAVKKSFEMVVLAVSQRWPVLLYGPAGAGKTALITKLAQDHGSRVLSIHMDDQIDGKTLIGSYVCTEQPGEFRWQPGSLTQAVMNGLWVVFEDIDKAPSDVQSILLPLLEGSSTFLTGHGEAVRVAEGFRLFSTVSSSKLVSDGRNSLSTLWRRVMIGSSSNMDLLSIVNAWYPNMGPLSKNLIETFERVNQIAGFHMGTSGSLSSIGRFSLRDLLKWCKRIAGLGFSFGGDGISAYACSSIYLEAVDIFAAFSSSIEHRLTIMRAIAKMWTVPISDAETFYPVNKPAIQDLRSELRIGRITLQRNETAYHREKKPFVEIRTSLHVLERIACSVKYNEPILLVGETGTGKTTLVQNLAMRLGQKITVLNLSQQSDVADLLGGFKPMSAQFVCYPLYMEFENLFTRTLSVKENVALFTLLQNYLSNKNWKKLLSVLQKSVKKVIELGRSKCGTKRKRPESEDKRPWSEELLKSWVGFSSKLETARAQISASDGMIFSFVEGAFVTALKNGEWILLDEVNLAPPETLQRVIGVLEEESGSLCLAERGDVDYIRRHPNFRLFACMNPATDAGKRDLPFSIRSRFTEYFVDDVLNDDDLILFINQFMVEDQKNRELIGKIVQFYKTAKKASEETLQDGANQKPQYSLRSLYRALEYTGKSRKEFKFEKALYDGFCMFFLNLLDEKSAKSMNDLILSHLLGRKVPPQVPFDRYLKIRENSEPNEFLENYVLTKSVKEHLGNLARAIFVGRYPVLLQGPTSSGKTSLVQFLAATTGHEFVRINNHQHTDLQEYLGSYITDATGKLIFHEGVLVKAVRSGHWIVLDELNLAPSDVLEALNRLLDDNRELFVPELRETIRAHPDFMLFATQNPPTFYGGRKMLSRAFRNRFVEIHVDEIPQDELNTILENRCKIPGSYAKKMVEVMKVLQLHRQSSKVFAGKHGFITPRDLFRWADRFRMFGKSYEDLSLDGYYLLAERLRDDAEKIVVQRVLEEQLRVKLGKDIYNQEHGNGNNVSELSKLSGISEDLGTIIWTRSMWRLFFLVERCYKLREPVLLVGETGGGKTTVCQLLSICLAAKLHILNCHQYTETSDFLGGFYPVRERSKLSSDFENLCGEIMLSKALTHISGGINISTDIQQASSTLGQLSLVINNYKQGLLFHPDVSLEEIKRLEQRIVELIQLNQKWQTIFMWQDGPLVEAMKNGDLFLVDEISLADDSVLERLNSVLEPERRLSLAEKGGSDLEQITAHPNFFILATMNPGGDYGKKELSPALRNRFTEIWVPSVSDLNELKSIALERIADPELSGIVDLMLKFWEWFNNLQAGRMLTVRDLLSWVAFIKVTKKSLQPDFAFLHGAFLVLLDGLSLGTSISKSEASELRHKCLSFLLDELKESNSSLGSATLSTMESFGWTGSELVTETTCTETLRSDSHFGIHPFYIEKGHDHFEVDGFEFMAPTTRKNALRVLRAMQLAKPVLLEGSPGVGKTSLIVALGKFSGHTVVRINLSEQTDIMDLLGSDLPVESDEGMKFAWSDGILLQALKQGYWVLLDELNLAPQSVLEGLNAILDHRAEVFIPELGLTFKCPPSFRVFACQNPSSQGGGRKGLPKSFLNRFTKVYVDELVEEDYLFICSSLYPSIPRTLLSKLILFNKRLHEDTMLHQKFGRDGSPWEFNLRDVTRSCQLIEGAPEKSKFDCFLNSVYIQRMRTSADRQEVIRIYQEVFGLKPFINMYPRVQMNPQYLVIGEACIKRNFSQTLTISSSNLKILPEMRQCLEAVACCAQNQWLSILIGSPSSGKTSLIRLLAGLTGNQLNELNLSSGTDISEILGCFEQYNAFRNYRLVIARVEHYINEYCSLQLEYSQESLIRRKDLVNRWLAFLSSTDYYFSTTAASTYADNWKSKSFSSAPLLVEIIENLRMDMEKNKLGVSWSTLDLDVNLKMIRKLQDDYERRIYSAKFEWVTGLLIKAIENGEWIVLENANLCNPTVLDRINSLVEPSGSITVNECGIVDGKPLILHPHPGFRMFLTVNPGYGEVSRAMRNRGVEIYTMPPYWLLNSNENHKEIELKDARKFLVLSGVPFTELIDSMAQAHIFARDTGLNLNVTITYLELSRWVQLFQRLLSNGNRPLWSLRISWEHTYLSSLGEVEGKDIVRYAMDSFLSLSKLDPLTPGSWPAPLNLHDFVSYSKEATVKQNCIYLEFIAAQNAIASAQCPVKQTLIRSSGYLGKYLVDMKMLRAIMFPKISSGRVGGYSGKSEYDHARVKQMIIFAANWTIEQATKHDFELYLLWFSWFGAQLQPVCQFFSSYVSLLKRELEHPIWKYILGFYSEIKETTPLPLLSLELVELSTSNDMLKSRCKLVTNAIQCVILLRVSLQQWNDEIEYTFSDDMKCFKPVLKSLRILEEEVLQSIVESPSFDRIFRLYNTLLEDHILLGKCINSSQFEYLLITWRSLVKNVAKLQQFFPREVENFQKESKNLSKVSSWSFQSQKSLLWVHGGHPFLPASADLYNKNSQLLNLCELVWPRKTKTQIGSTVEDVISCDPELRTLAMQGLCMSTYIIRKADESESSILKQLEEMHQMLSGKVEHEKKKLEISTRETKPDSSMADISSCCVFSIDILCRKAGFGGWRQTLPIIDHTSFFLDMGLLQNLAKAVVADEEKLHSMLLCLSADVESALNFSLNFSSRPPTDFLPHQKILWTLDAWTSVDDVITKNSSFVLEMWFRWHTSLWKYSPVVDDNILGLHGHGALLPDILFQPVKMIIVDQLLKGKSTVGDYYMHKLQLRAASRNLWQSSPTAANLHSFLLSAAQSLFQQIIFAHKKSFEADKYATLKHKISSLSEKMITQDDINVVISLLKSSSHPELASRMAQIGPLLSILNNIHNSSTDSIYHLGCAWLTIGGLRHSLLICCDDLDPVMKYSFKHTQMLEKLASLELEIEVRNECVHSAGCLSSRQDSRQKSIELQNLHAEQKRLQRRIVFRSDPGKFLKLKYENMEFTNLVAFSFDLAKNVQNLTVQDMISKVHNWQETATRFIDRLSNEYPAYIDIVQPVQAAVYEMKLGLALVLSGALRKRFLEKVGQGDMEIVLGAIYSFMRFSRSFATETVSPVVQSSQSSISTCDIKFPTHVELMDTDLLESLVSLTSDIASNDGMASIKQMKATFDTNILLRIAYSAAETRFLDRSSFMLMDKIFKGFANFWMNMKDEVKNKEEQESQQYKFKPRAIMIDNIVDVDISTLGSMVSNETFTEWQEFLCEGDSSEERKAEAGDEALEDDWNFLQESILTDIIHIHNSLFGSEDLVRSPGSFKISEANHLSLFKDSYAIGVKMIKSLEGALPSSLDAKLTPEHLLRLSLDYEKNFSVSPQSTRLYNFYKDSNAPVMAKMVDPLAALKERISILMTEWDDHPALQKILDVIDMILAIPLSTPLAKALSALQFLLNRVQILRETVSKFPLSDQLEPILALVLSWKKLEFESWPALLDEVQSQYEINAGKLWFPLYSILGRTQPADLKKYSELTSQSLKEYIETSNIGEFKKRLQLLFAMHGHINTGITQGVCSSCFQAENEKILYNIFGFYVQSLPLISESINAGRKSIELELKDLLRLCRWERSDIYLTMDNSKKTRQKFKKIIQKYNDLLQQPFMLLLKQEAARRGMASQTTQDSIPRVTFDKNVNILKDACDQPDFRDEDRSAWINTWKTKTNASIQNLQVVRTTEFGSPDSSLVNIEEVARIIKDCVSSPSLCVEYQEERREVWDTIRKICETAIHCGNIWKEGNKSLRMRKALSDLLKCLDSCGLSKHRSDFLEGDQLAQPSYIMQHLLLTDGMTSENKHDKLQTSPLDNLETEWRSANQSFFRSISSVRQLRQICLNFHKDFTLEQVTRSLSYLDHLIAIQQEQRTAAYDFATCLNILKKSLLPLENLFSTSDPLSSDLSSFPLNQHATFKCMWQQKQLFDGSCSLLHDLCLLLQTVESSHLDTCRNVKVLTKRLLLFIEEFVQDFKKSKESLDDYLLGKDRIITSLEVKLQPNGVTKQMEQLVCENFSFIREFEERVSAFRKQDVDLGSVAEILFGHLESIFVKGKFIAEEYECALRARNHPEHMDEDSDRSISGFAQALEQTYKDIMDSFSKVGSSNSFSLTENSLENICTWKAIFESNVSSLKLKEISDGLVNTIQFAGENEGRTTHLKHLYSLLDPTLTYSHGLLLDFLVMHRAVSQMTDELAKIFASLYSQGYPSSTEEQGDETGPGKETPGTGIGDGAGKTDVSDQITDEDQVMANSEKPNEEDEPQNVPSKTEKGIEMETEFGGDTFSVSEGSSDDEKDENGDEDEKNELPKELGDAGDDSEIVGAKPWDEEDDNGDDENPNKETDKYESGPSVKDNDPKNRELRGKDETAPPEDNNGEVDKGEPTEDKNGSDDEGQNPEDANNQEDDMIVDKDDAFAEPTGLKLEEDKPSGIEDDKPEEKPGPDDDVEMDEQQGDAKDDVDDGLPEEIDVSVQEENKKSAEGVNEEESDKLAGEIEKGDSENKQEKDTEMNPVSANNSEFRPGVSDLMNNQTPNAESATRPVGDSQTAAGSRDVAQEAQWSNCNDTQDDVASMRGLPNSAENEIAVSDLSKGGKVSDEQPKSELPQPESSSLQKVQPNPCRNIGDALDGWKDRIKVSVDLEDNKAGEEIPDDTGDENAAEYGFTSNNEKGTAQALGTATSDQTDSNINGMELDKDDGGADRNRDTDMETEDEQNETRPVSSHAVKLNTSEEKEVSKTGKQSEVPLEVDNINDGYKREDDGSLVTMKVSNYNQTNPFGKLSADDNNDDLGKVSSSNMAEMTIEMKNNASNLWRQYELRTTRLCQELCEQLRLVMEPTLASKLQGDYKTGKRINMKKVIPYIASHYRKDKIWLRRTRPNKRDYQVVIAVDDSRSMSESNCGDVATEALVTVCRAMSQLEVGNMAVASYGKKGNIKLLHEFDQPFTGEAGAKMVSSLTFQQENTVLDKPMLDLLKYLNNMLDDAAAMARLPSGHNPLQQLVLIIADGKLTEKDELKRYVRDLLSKKRMVAFLLLDSGKESIMDLQEISFENNKIESSKYMDSFPFPFYVVLRNIEALPSTLADLLRQWFELMQYSRD